jgi:hypothetical protein
VFFVECRYVNVLDYIANLWQPITAQHDSHNEMQTVIATVSSYAAPFKQESLSICHVRRIEREF